MSSFPPSVEPPVIFDVQKRIAALTQRLEYCEAQIRLISDPNDSRRASLVAEVHALRAGIAAIRYVAQVRRAAE